jgi:hypothetical protein
VQATGRRWIIFQAEVAQIAAAATTHSSYFQDLKMITSNSTTAAMAPTIVPPEGAPAVAMMPPLPFAADPGGAMTASQDGSSMQSDWSSKSCGKAFIKATLRRGWYKYPIVVNVDLTNAHAPLSIPK